jgi:hypothetical protein
MHPALYSPANTFHESARGWTKYGMVEDNQCGYSGQDGHSKSSSGYH